MGLRNAAKNLLPSTGQPTSELRSLLVLTRTVLGVATAPSSAAAGANSGTRAKTHSTGEGGSSRPKLKALIPHIHHR